MEIYDDSALAKRWRQDSEDDGWELFFLLKAEKLFASVWHQMVVEYFKIKMQSIKSLWSNNCRNGKQPATIQFAGSKLQGLFTDCDYFQEK